MIPRRARRPPQRATRAGEPAESDRTRAVLFGRRRILRKRQLAGCRFGGRARSVVFAVLAVLGAMGAGPGWASEAGGHNIAMGAETIGSGYMPPPGKTMLYGYFLWLSANSVRDNAGNSSVPEFRADLYANAMQFVHTYEHPWYGFDVSSAFVYILDYAKTKAGTTRDENGDLSDFAFQPIMLTRGWGNFHFLYGTIIYYPFGKYHPQDVANASTHYGHYVTLIQEAAVTWMPKPWLDFSFQPCVATNMRNHRTGYRSGSLMTIDWGITARPFPGLRALGMGMGGFYGHQFTDDTQNGVPVPGKRLTKIGLGPQFIYNLSDDTALILKYQRETHVANTARANLVWLEFALPLHL